jgi:hypothetical protein
MKGHKLTIDGTRAYCQCNAWQWPVGPELAAAHARHLEAEEAREAELMRLASEQPARASRFGKIGQIALTIAAFAAIMFTVLHFTGL